MGARLGLFFQAAIKPQEKTALKKDKCTITVILKEIQVIFISLFEMLQAQHPSDIWLLLLYPSLHLPCSHQRLIGQNGYCFRGIQAELYLPLYACVKTIKFKIH